MALKPNPREELIFLMRGFFSTPLISIIGKLDIFNRLNKKSFKLKDIKQVKNKKTLKSILQYLMYLGLIKGKNKNYYLFTALGKKVFSRSGSFNIIHSYKNYINNLDKIFNKKNYNFQCDRAENVLGSGQTNGRKFFPAAYNVINRNKYSSIFDIGCGNGFFLNEVKKKYPRIKIFGSDISSKSIRLSKKIKNIKLIKCDAFNINKWSRWIKNKNRLSNEKSFLITLWFVIHEISNNDTQKIINFFNKIYKKFPNATIFVGELVKPKTSIMVKNRYASIMPEYMLFHDLSGQGVLNYFQLKYILKNIPYKLVDKNNFDMIKHKSTSEPSAITWLLKPKKKLS